MNERRTPPGPHRSRRAAPILRETLLDRFAPPALMIDRSYRVLHFHGDTDVFPARRSGLRLISTAERLEIEVRDDGRGMAEIPAAGPGMGLQIMRHRAELVGGARDRIRARTGFFGAL